MTNEQKIKYIEKHQACGRVHPLTCGNNSGHQNLVAVEKDKDVILKCLDCDYVQSWVPGWALSMGEMLENGEAWPLDDDQPGRL